MEYVAVSVVIGVVAALLVGKRSKQG